MIGSGGGSAGGWNTLVRIPPEPGTTRVGRSRPQSPLARQPDVAMAIGVQPVRGSHGPLGVVAHQGRGGGMQSEIISPHGYDQRSYGACIRSQHSLKRDAHGMHNVRLNAIDETTEFACRPPHRKRTQDLTHGCAPLQTQAGAA
jgi:hypothetical protein